MQYTTQDMAFCSNHLNCRIGDAEEDEARHEDA